MSLSRRTLVAAACVLFSATAGSAQSWPERPITFVVPFPAGGGTDTFARPLAAELTKQLGKSIIVDNKGGAGGTLGAGLAAKAAPDGYTFFLGAVHHAIAPSVYPTLTYDLIKDFVPVSMVSVVPQVVVIHPSIQANNLTDLIALAKKEPGKMTYASAGAGTSHHLAGELFKSLSGVDILHVPYKGAGPALQDLIGGQISMMFDGLGSSAGHIAGGRIKALAVAAKTNAPGPMGSIPTSAQAGLPGYEVSTWYALWAPAKTPPDIVARMTAEMKKALESDALKRVWDQQGAVTGETDPQKMNAFVASEIARWAKVAKEGDIKVE